MGDAASQGRVEAILAEREARVLRVPVYVRFVLALLIVPNIGSAAAEMIGDPVFLYGFYGIVLVWAALNGYFLWSLVKKRRVAVVGIVGAALDVAFVAAQLAIGMIVLGGEAVPATGVFKSQLPAFGVALVAINALALRPR